MVMLSYLTPINQGMNSGFPSLPGNSYNPFIHHPQKPFINEPTSFDILLGKEKAIFNHTGNRSFRAIINSHLDKYIAAPTKSSKSKLIRQVHADMQKSGYRFLRKNEATGIWNEIEKHEAREKVSHALRDRVREQQKPTKRKRKSACAEEIAPISVATPIEQPQPEKKRRAKKPSHAVEAVVQHRHRINLPTLCNDDFMFNEPIPRNFFDVVTFGNEPQFKAQRRFSLLSLDDDTPLKVERRCSLFSVDDAVASVKAHRRFSMLSMPANKAPRRLSLLSIDDVAPTTKTLRRLSMLSMMDGFPYTSQHYPGIQSANEEFEVLEMEHDFTTHLDRNEDDFEPYHAMNLNEVDDETAAHLVEIACAL